MFDLTIDASATAYTSPAASSQPSPVLTTNEFTFNIEVDTPISAPQDQVQQLLDAEDLVPVHKPTVMDVCSFQEALANALAQSASALFFEENVGHSFLIESYIDYQAHTGVNVLSKWPTTSAALGTAPETPQLRLHETQQKSFVI